MDSNERRYLELRESVEQALAEARALRAGTQASRDAWQQVAEIELTIASQMPANTEAGSAARVAAIHALARAGENTRALALRHAVLDEEIDAASRAKLLDLTVSPTNHNRYYLGNFEGALRFQDMVADAMFDHGLSLGNYLAIDRSCGSENRLGMEIKWLRNYRTHLFFEVAERRGPESAELVP